MKIIPFESQKLVKLIGVLFIFLESFKYQEKIVFYNDEISCQVNYTEKMMVALVQNFT